MKKLLVALLLLSSSAYAADLPYKAAAPMAAAVIVPTWTGFYVGINGGGGFQSNNLNINGLDTNSSFAVATGIVPNSLNTRGGGGLFGGTVGYNYQFSPQWVVGIEGDIDWSGIKGSDSKSLSLVPLSIPVSLTTTGESKLDWIGTVRGRIGYLITPTLLVYGTGGLAFGEVNNTASSVLTLGSTSYAATFNNSPTKTGWTAGAGFEHQFWGGWSVKAEYRYVDLGSNSGQFGVKLGEYQRDPVVTFGANQNNTYQMGLIGVNYKFYP